MTKFLAIALVLCVALVLGFALVTDDAFAQGKGSDKELATKKGFDALETKEFDKDKLPGKLEVGMTVAATIVMIAVVKWL